MKPKPTTTKTAASTARKSKWLVIGGIICIMVGWYFVSKAFPAGSAYEASFVLQLGMVLAIFGGMLLGVAFAVTDHESKRVKHDTKASSKIQA